MDANGISIECVPDNSLMGYHMTEGKEIPKRNSVLQTFNNPLHQPTQLLHQQQLPGKIKSPEQPSVTPTFMDYCGKQKCTLRCEMQGSPHRSDLSLFIQGSML
eukprot:1159521-Pelagomonas_calceolata.AAC.2